METSQKNHKEIIREDDSAPSKKKWHTPVIVPLDTKLTEMNDGVGFDGEVGWPDSTRS